MKYRILVIAAIGLLASCTIKTIKLKNVKQGQLQATKTLKLVETKKILLDSNTARSPQYSQRKSYYFKDVIYSKNR